MLDTGWEQNIGFARPEGPDDFFGALRASMARVRRGPRSDFRLRVTGVGYLYGEQTNQNRADAFVDLRTQGPLSPRVDGRLSGGYAAAHSDSDESLIVAGVLLPLVRTRTAGAAGGVTWRAAERTSVSVDGSWNRTDFEAVYLDTTYWLGTVSLARRIASRDEVLVNGSFRRTEDDLSTRQGPTLTAGYGHVFGSSLRLGLAAGAGEEEARPSTPGQATRRTQDFYFAANLDGRVRRSTVSVGYEHARRPRVGLGVSEVADTFTLGLVIPIGRRVELLANGGLAVWQDDSSPDAANREDWDAYFGAASRLTSRLRLVLGYRLRARSDSLGTVRNDRATISLAYAGSAR